MNHYFTQALAREQQRERLKEARVNRLLKEAHVIMPGPSKRMLLVALGCVFPIALLVARVAIGA